MRLSKYWNKAPAIESAIAIVVVALFHFCGLHLAAQQAPLPQTIQQSVPDSSSLALDCESSVMSSPYIPVDSWIYSAVMRLYAMGYASNVYLGMRPWTRASVSHMLEGTSAQIQDAHMYGDSTVGEARALYAALERELHPDMQGPCRVDKGKLAIESSYSEARAISGTPLRDSFHLGSSVINDYGRPFEHGFNNYSGLSGYVSAGRYLIYARGEFQAASSGTGHSQTLAQTLSNIDKL